MPPTSITLEELSDFFHLPEKQVAQQMGMCLTSLKKICRAHGITRWPFRKLKSLERTMQKVNADSSSISAQLGKSGAEAARSANSSVDSSRAASPTMKIDCSDKALMQPPVRRAPTSNNSRNPMTPGTPKCSASPKAESAVHRSALAHSQAAGDSCWPSFTISGTEMQQLVISNWSSLWTVHHLHNQIVRPLGVLEMSISEDGAKAHFHFASSLAALQARRVCEEACSILQSQQQLAEEARASEALRRVPNPTARFAHTDFTSHGVSTHAPPQPQTSMSGSNFLISDAVQPASSSISPPSGVQPDDDESGAWMLPLMPGTSGAPTSSTRWVSSILSPPQSCGSGSGSSSTSMHNDSESWLSPCLVSC